MQIEIDFDVFKEITARRTSERVTENDVLRAMFGLPTPDLGDDNSEETGRASPGGSAWICKSVIFPVGSRLRARYQGQLHHAEVEADGIRVRGQLATSPSQAANFVTGTNVNGWTFWEVQLRGHPSWMPLQALRLGLPKP